MKNKLAPLFLSFLLTGAFVMMVFAGKAQAAQVAVTGFAWSENIGWIQMDHGVNSVSLDNSIGVLSGYGWSENIGWVKFGGLSAFPGAGGNAVVYFSTDGNVTGWIRACAGTAVGDCSNMTSRTDGWDGWINMDVGSGNGVKVDTSTGDFSGWAWGSDVVGWINFTGVNTGIACTPLTFNPATSGLSLASDDTGLTNSLSLNTTQTPFYAYVDYGLADNYIIEPYSGTYTCAWDSWLNTTVGKFVCATPPVGGPYIYTSGTRNDPLPDPNICASVSPAIGTLTVTAPIIPTVSISANPPGPLSSINTGTKISWSSTDATSCIVTHGAVTDWTTLQGTDEPTGPIPSTGATYLLVCQPGPVSDQVSISVLSPKNLVVVKVGQGGTVTSSPVGINCGPVAGCSSQYDPGTVITLTENPNGRVFMGWKGINGTSLSCDNEVDMKQPTCTFTINDNMEISASFAINPGYKEF